MEWGWGFRFVSQSSKPMVGSSQRRPHIHTDRSLKSTCLWPKWTISEKSWPPQHQVTGGFAKYDRMHSIVGPPLSGRVRKFGRNDASEPSHAWFSPPSAHGQLGHSPHQCV